MPQCYVLVTGQSKGLCSFFHHVGLGIDGSAVFFVFCTFSYCHINIFIKMCYLLLLLCVRCVWGVGVYIPPQCLHGVLLSYLYMGSGYQTQVVRLADLGDPWPAESSCQLFCQSF